MMYYNNPSAYKFLLRMILILLLSLSFNSYNEHKWKIIKFNVRKMQEVTSVGLQICKKNDFSYKFIWILYWTEIKWHF